MGHCTPAATGASAPREAIPAPTDADRAAAFAPLHAGHAHGAGIHSKIQFNRLETWDADPGSGQAWEGRAWFGGDLRRLWLRSEGERIGGSTHGPLTWHAFVAPPRSWSRAGQRRCHREDPSIEPTPQHVRPLSS